MNKVVDTGAATHYRYVMNHRNPSCLRALLFLLLIAGPLQAQTIFACAMMGTALHDGCCCDEHDADDVALDSNAEPCCERSVAVTVDQDAKQGTSVGKALEVRSNPDPPQALVSSCDSLISLEPSLSVRVFHSLPAAAHSGSETWLVTQRLRI